MFLSPSWRCQGSDQGSCPCWGSSPGWGSSPCWDSCQGWDFDSNPFLGLILGSVAASESSPGSCGEIYREISCLVTFPSAMIESFSVQSIKSSEEK